MPCSKDREDLDATNTRIDVIESTMRSLIEKNKVICDCILDITHALDASIEAHKSQGDWNDSMEKSIAGIVKYTEIFSKSRIDQYK